MAAEAGLLSSWARPADIVPSEASRSRFCSRWVIRRDHRPHLGHHAQEHRPVGAHEVDERVGGDDRQAHLAAGDHPHRRRAAHQRRDRPDPGRRDVIADRLVAVPSSTRASIVPSRMRMSPVLVSSCLAYTAPAGRSWSSAASHHVCSSSSVSSVNRSMGRRSATVGWLMPPPDTRGSATPPSSPRRRRVATRLIERARTSPATNTPGTLVSSGARLALQRPAVLAGLGAGEDEAALVAGDDAVEPVGARRGADEHEAGVDVHRALVAVRPAEPQPLQPAVVALGRRSPRSASAPRSFCQPAI